MSEKIVEAAAKIVQCDGADSLTVRRILQHLGISNRVFYNRFKNIDQVLQVIYKRVVVKIREGVLTQVIAGEDFFEKVIEMVANSLSMSYDAKKNFNRFFYDIDSLTDSNYIWWTSEIKKLIDFAMERGYIKQVDSEVLSYSIWCFCRGYNTDAVTRGLPKEKAISDFKYSFSFLLDGLRINNEDK